MENNARGRFHPFFQTQRDGPQVIAHRGGAGEWPEETIYALEQAVNAAVDILEVDVRYTADDDLVLMHNANVKDTTGVDKLVKKLTSAEIQSLDAASWWRGKGVTFPPGAKLNVPRLEDVLAQFREQRIVIEIKPRDFPPRLVRQLGRLIRKYDLAKRVLVASGWTLPLLLFRREFSEVATSASVSEMIAFRNLNWVGFRPNADAIQTISRIWKFERINEKFVRRVHDANLIVDGWTVNNAEEMGRLVKTGIDGIITDEPTKLMKLLKRRLEFEL